MLKYSHKTVYISIDCFSTFFFSKHAVFKSFTYIRNACPLILNIHPIYAESRIIFTNSIFVHCFTPLSSSNTYHTSRFASFSYINLLFFPVFPIVRVNITCNISKRPFSPHIFIDTLTMRDFFCFRISQTLCNLISITQIVYQHTIRANIHRRNHPRRSSLFQHTPRLHDNSIKRIQAMSIQIRDGYALHFGIKNLPALQGKLTGTWLPA